MVETEGEDEDEVEKDRFAVNQYSRAWGSARRAKRDPV